MDASAGGLRYQDSIIKQEGVEMKKPNLKEIYKGIRKPMAPPTKAERDRRAELEDEEARREMERHQGRDTKRKRRDE